MLIVEGWKGQACLSLHIDVIALDVTEPSLFILRTALVKAALKRGIFFEICYSKALQSDANRRVFFQNAAGKDCSLMWMCKRRVSGEPSEHQSDKST